MLWTKYTSLSVIFFAAIAAVPSISMAGVVSYTFDPGPVTYSQENILYENGVEIITIRRGADANKGKHFYQIPRISVETSLLPYDLRGTELFLNSIFYPSGLTATRNGEVVFESNFSLFYGDSPIPNIVPDWITDLQFARAENRYHLLFDTFGDIVNWNIEFDNDHPYSSYDVNHSSQSDLYRFGNSGEGIESESSFFYTDGPGKWTRNGELPPAAVPLPAGGMLLLGAMAFLFSSRRRHQAV
tara:strand:- start:353 stop:1081 length:729 start_codon:yes stop_codon:yes gene_type:complete